MSPNASQGPGVAEIGARFKDLERGISSRIVGLDEVVEDLLVCLLSGGHCLLTGVPGLAKTLLVSTVSELLSLEYRRIQFTPDLMPADITGTEVIAQDRQTGERSFRYLPGPIFANIILADEINRTPPKTQSALLEAMEEGYVTSVGQRHALDSPFFVLATQNPIEQEGTYPLPAAQLDRFMMNVPVDYPSETEEYRIIRKTISGPPAALEPILSRDEIVAILGRVRRTAAPDDVVREAMRVVRATRPEGPTAAAAAKESLSWGAGPRAAHAIITGAKARALIRGRETADRDDVWALVRPVLRHRLIPNYRAIAGQISTDEVLDRIDEELRGPRETVRVGWLPRVAGFAKGLIGGGGPRRAERVTA